LSLAQAAKAGGFVQVGIRPESLPVVHDKSGINYLLTQGKKAGIHLLPLGAVSRDLAGKDIAELWDMSEAGAVAFTDGVHGIQHAGLMVRALLYVKAFDGVVFNQPLDKTIAGSGQMHEGQASTMMGTKGIPSIAEEVMVARDLQLLAYTESRLHFSHIATAGAVEQIRKAKAAGLRVTASVAALNLLLSDEALSDFDSHLKVLPPLRHETDRLALIAGLQDGTIDCISSNHTPLEVELKALEFAYADFGAEMLETAFGCAATALRDHLAQEAIIACFTTGPRKILGLPAISIAEGQPAQLTFYDYHHSWTPGITDIRSRSKNAPLIGYPLIGKPIAVETGL
ncbi:MAG: dihydroorotase, partial [Saprospiraceae bacterium]